MQSTNFDTAARRAIAVTHDPRIHRPERRRPVGVLALLVAALGAR
jgi:hypothetical protein